MSIVLQSTSGGSVTISEPTTASNFTQTLPAGTGTVVVSGINSAITAATAQTASGTSVDFTAIPSWVKRITVVMTDVSFAAGGVARIRLGTSGGLVASGYTSTSTVFQTTPAIGLTSITDGIGSFSTSSAASVVTGQFIIVNLTGNTWQANGYITRLADNTTQALSGFIALSGTLDRLSVVATTSTFDAGSINILYE